MLDGTYDRQLPSNRFKGSLATSWKIGTATVDINAALNNAGSAGWDFEGSIKNLNLSVSSFLTDTFDGVFPGRDATIKSGAPPMISDATIKSLDARFNTETKDFHFDAEIEFGKDVDTVLTFSNLHQEGTPTPTFEKLATGVMTVFPGMKEKEFAFDLALDIKQDSKHFIALYSDATGKAVTLGNLVNAMIPGAAQFTPIRHQHQGCDCRLLQ